MLSYGFPTAHLPELCVRLVRRASPLERFRLAVRKVIALHGKQRVKVAFQSVLSEGPSGLSALHRTCSKTPEGLEARPLRFNF